MPSNWMSWLQLSPSWPVVCCSCEENSRALQFLFSHRNWGPSPSLDYFPTGFIQCAALFCNLIPFPGRNNRPGLICSQGMNMQVPDRMRCSFRAKSHLRRWHCSFGSYLERQSGLWFQSCSPAAEEALKVRGAPGSWTSAFYFLMRRASTSHSINTKHLFYLMERDRERKKEKPSKTECTYKRKSL